MSEAFDPYCKWLGIPPQQQPANHYRLLAIPPFESDREVVCNAADLRKAYLKSLPAGQHSGLLKKLLDEVSTASVCLLNADRKQPYDRQLRSALPAAWAAHLQRSGGPQLGADSDGFDPYHQWLGIHADRQPADHYHLLGLVAFESDREVIENAADGRMGYVKTFGTGQHSALSQKLLNELAAARVCLLTAKKKRAYDEQLQAAVAEKYSDALQPDAPTPPPVSDVDLPKARPVPLRPEGATSDAAPTQQDQAEEVAPELAALFRRTQTGQRSSPGRRILAPSERSRRLRPMLYVAAAVVLLILAWTLMPGSTPSLNSPTLSREVGLVLTPIRNESIKEGQHLTVPLKVKPSGWRDPVEFNLVSGPGEIRGHDFVWTPMEEHGGGVYEVEISAIPDENEDLRDTKTFVVTVEEVYERPIIDPIEDQFMAQDGLLLLLLRVKDPDTYRTSDQVQLKYSLQGVFPERTKIDPDTGLFECRATEEDADKGFSITVNVVKQARGSVVLKKAQKTFNLHVSHLKAGLVASLFEGKDLNEDQKITTQVHTQLDFDWHHGAPDDAPLDHFSFRWEGFIKAPKAGRYTLIVSSDDGVRVWVNDKKVIECWAVSVWPKLVGEVDLSDQPLPIKIEYFEATGGASIRLRWKQEAGFEEHLMPAAALFHDPQSAKDATLVHSELAGNHSGRSFEELTEMGHLAGFQLWSGDSDDGVQVIRSIQPIFRTIKGKQRLGHRFGEGGNGPTRVVADAGYAVGGLLVRGRSRINAVRLIFMPVHEGALDPEDSKLSDAWFPSATAGAQRIIGGTGRLATGIHGRVGTDIEAIGLLLDTVPIKTYTSLGEALKEPDKVRKLDLSNSGLTGLPSQIKDLRELIVLDVSGNKLTSLTPDIRNLTKLRYLNVADNQIGDLPSQIALLREMRKLNLSNNQLEEYPVWVYTMNKLRVLNMANNQITSFPAHAAATRDMRELSLRGNKLTSLPEQIGWLDKMTLFDLRDNQLTSLPQRMDRLRSLKHVLLSGNPLPAAEIENLKRKLPNANIVFEPTANGT